MLEHGQVFQRLDQIVGGAQAQRLDRIAHNTGTGHHDDRQIGLTLADLANQFEAVHLRHAQVADHQIGLLGLEQRHAFLTAAGLQHANHRIQIACKAGPHHIVHPRSVASRLVYACSYQALRQDDEPERGARAVRGTRG
ncbi:hypothetical protein SSTU70S_03458 [Stutzerimonas stutzeri]